MIYIDKYAYMSKLKIVNGQTKIIFSLFTLGVCLWANNITTWGAIILTMFFLCVAVAHIPIGYYCKLLLLPIVFLFLSVVGIVVNVSTAPIAQTLMSKVFVDAKAFGLYFCVTESGVNLAFSLTLKAMGAVSCLYFLVLTTPMPEIIAFLKKCKLSRFITEQLTLVYRFIFILLEIANVKVKVTQMRFGNGRAGFSRRLAMKRSIKTIGMVISSVFVQAYQHALAIHNAMLARGYDGEIRMLRVEQPVRKWDLPIVVFYELAIIAMTITIQMRDKM